MVPKLATVKTSTQRPYPSEPRARKRYGVVANVRRGYHRYSARAQAEFRICLKRVLGDSLVEIKSLKSSCLHDVVLKCQVVVTRHHFRNERLKWRRGLPA